MFANALDVSPTNIFSYCCKDSEDLNILTAEIKEKLVSSTYSEKVKLLTLTPQSWSIDYTSNYFNVSRYLVRKSGP